MVGGQDGRSTNSERASFDCKTAEDGLYAVSKRTVVDTHRKHVEVNDSLESDQADLGLKRVGLTAILAAWMCERTRMSKEDL